MQSYQNGQFTRDVPALPGHEGTVQTGNIVPRFFTKYVKNKKSGELVEQEYVEMLIAGDTKNAPVAKVTDSHRSRWPRHYEAFKAQQSFVGEGTPIEAWGAIDASTARTLRAMNIMTVEQMAELTDSAVGNLHGGHTLRDKARQYVSLQGSNVENNKLVHEMSELKQQNEMLQRQVSELATMAQKLSEEKQPAAEGDSSVSPEAIKARLEAVEKPRKRGRPRKNA